MARKSLAEQIAERDWGVSWEESWGGCLQACRPGQNRRQIRRAIPQSQENGAPAPGVRALAPNRPADGSITRNRQKSLLEPQNRHRSRL